MQNNSYVSSENPTVLHGVLLHGPKVGVQKSVSKWHALLLFVHLIVMSFSDPVKDELIKNLYYT